MLVPLEWKTPTGVTVNLSRQNISVKGPKGELKLALVKHVLNRHRGRLVVDSKAGEGATFTVRLPLAPIPAAP